MIAIASSSVQERVAFAALCASRGWTYVECDSLRALKKLLRATRPRIVLTRYKLSDGYSDDVIAALAAAGLLSTAKVIVLLGPGATAAQEARQVSLGADSVHRDPVRSDVLTEYLAKYFSRSKKVSPKSSRAAASKPFRFAGAAVNPAARRLQHAGRVAALTPREVQLAELLFESRGEVVNYTTLYSEILGSNFRGDTSNMRVLLGKLDASFRSVGLNVRTFVHVTPKMGYRYSPRPQLKLHLAKLPRAVTTHAA